MHLKVFRAFVVILGLIPAAIAQSTAASPSQAPAPQSVPPTSQVESAPSEGVSPIAHAPEAAADVPVTLTNDQIKEMVRKSADNDMENDRKQRDYTFVQRAEMHFLDGHGEAKKNESETTEIMVLYGEQVERKIAKNDQPLSEKDAAKEEKRIQELIEKRKNESEQDRQKRLSKKEKEREDARRFVQEIADAFDFTYRGVEPIDGHRAYVIDCEPRSGYQPRQKEAKYLTKFRGRVWIDTAELQLVKMDAEAIDTVSWGLFLARIHKGAHVFVEQTRVNDEVWLPKRVQLKFDGRLALLKALHMDIDIAFKDYKKFGASSRIVSVGSPVTEPHP